MDCHLAGYEDQIRYLIGKMTEKIRTVGVGGIEKMGGTYFPLNSGLGKVEVRRRRLKSLRPRGFGEVNNKGTLKVGRGSLGRRHIPVGQRKRVTRSQSGGKKYL